MKKRDVFLVLAVAVSMSLNLHGQNEPIVFEAESGTRGSDYTELTDGVVTYITPQTDYANTEYPGNATKVVSFQVIFTDSGTYKLFARVRVGGDAADDDSFYYGSGFGSKDPATGDDWTTVNQLHTAGFSIVDDVVEGQGDATTELWKWVALSDFTGNETPLTFRVDLGELIKTLEIGAREDGLDIDKLAFGREGIYYTVDNLDNEESGSEYPPGEEPIGPPLADSLDKFLGCAFGPDSRRDFAGYWNQVTPGNAGKWGWVEGTRDNMSWTDYDEAYQLAMDSGFFFKHHVLVWGNQQPSWIETLDSTEQRSEIEEWFAAVADWYPGINQVEVVNEPLHDPPDQAGEGGGNYIQALGGSGVTGWDWILEAFRMARTAFTDTTSLMINEYSIMNSIENTDDYREIIDLLIAEDTLIDAIGIQAHSFSHGATVETIQRNLDTLAATGLPLYITEFDVDGYTDRQQVSTYMKLFPLFWEHPSVQGITLWGFRPGMWRTEQMAYLIDADGEERPAMTWLRAYLKEEFVPNESLTISTSSGETSIDTDNGTLQMLAEVLPANTTLETVHWFVSDDDLAEIDQDGVLTAKNNGTVTVTATSLEYESDVEDSMEITISEQILGIESFSGAADITIFPNPVVGELFTIRGMEGISELAVFDLNGNQITSMNTQNQSTLDIRLNVPAGMYIVRLSDGTRFYHTKIVVR